MINKFKYCPNCKKNLQHLSERLINCPSCGFHFYISPAATNAAILESQKKEILLVKRKFEPYIGYWDLPGGFIEYNEPCEESVQREIKEELSIKIKNFTYLCSFTDIYPYKKFNYHTLCFFYTAKLSAKQEKDLKYSDDISGFKFFKKTEVPYDKLAFKGLGYAIKKYLSSFS